MKQTKLATKLMILTFLRTNELRWAEWTEFDFDAKDWRVPAERMKGNKVKKATAEDHIVPLAPQTIALLEDLKAITGNYRLLFLGVQKP